LPFGEDVGAGSDVEALHHVLLNQKNGDALRVDARDQRE